MDMPTSGKEVQGTSDTPSDGQETNTRTATRTPSIIVGIVAAVVVALSLFYLLRPEPLLVQGEADATRLDIAARVDGRVKEIPVVRGQNVPANAVLVKIDNPETVAKLEQMKAAKAVADAQLANILVGTRAETLPAPRPRERFMLSNTVSTAISAFVLVMPVRFTTSLMMSSLIKTASSHTASVNLMIGLNLFPCQAIACGSLGRNFGVPAGASPPASPSPPFGIPPARLTDSR